MPDKTQIGSGAEGLAAEFLRENGYKILERNYRSHYGEIDIIAVDGDCTVFVEVKFRSSRGFGWPQDSVVKRKQERIIRTALQYMKIKSLFGSKVRFDVVAVGPGAIEIFKDAFNSGLRKAY
ncbi:MAG: YraN family protein [Elusimicrobiota bacterium]